MQQHLLTSKVLETPTTRLIFPQRILSSLRHKTVEAYATGYKQTMFVFMDLTLQGHATDRRNLFQRSPLVFRPSNNKI